jgi:glycosyltransferase involved in cell wall biosynthesis
MENPLNRFKKVAVAADIVLKYGGAEKVLESFLNMFPESDLYTLFITPGARLNIARKFPKVNIHTSPFQILVKNDSVSKYISIIKLISWIYWEQLNLKNYDLVVSSSHSFMSKNVKKEKGAIHLSYIHTPPRFLYKEFCELNFIKRFPLNLFLLPVFVFLRKIDYWGSKRPDIIVVNSNNVKDRVEKYYKRNATVVYPAIEVIKCSNVKKEKYFVCLSRLVKQKGIALAVETCTKYKIPLVVLGDGDELEYLKKIAGETIEFKNNCDDLEKTKILAGARGLIYPSIEEDFGIVPVEAGKLGIPVVAYKSGGVQETVKDGVNGILFKEYTVLGLKKALDRLDKSLIGEKVCKESAKKYSFEIFKNQITDLLSNI